MEAAEKRDRVPPEKVPPLPEDLFRSGDVTALAHFYRGEMNRLTIWRTRMDFTTNWAVIAAAGLLTFSFRNPNADAIFLLTIATLWFLLTVESRRYRFYDVWRWRMRILEAHFLVPILTRESNHLRGPWREDLTADLLYPTFKMTMREAMGRRLLRNYIYLFALTLVVSLAHIFGISPATSSWAALTHEYLGASMRENWLLLCLIVITYVPLVGLAVFGWRRRKVIVELHDQPVRRSYRV
ncbi:MAG: DUF2270 domain-containing protein [Candidatus Eisenbacteria bacterium]|nr:DUF2270 domain-containing protein [Candidatus Eisenbacteria bacterium]